MSELDDFKATYFDECSELLSELEEQFAAIEEGDREADRLNAVFRAIHSIKGGAGAFGFSGLVGFAHDFETLLDYVRNGKVEMTDEVVALCIRANDIVADFVAAARNGEELASDYGEEEKARFVALCRGEEPTELGADERADGGVRHRLHAGGGQCRAAGAGRKSRAGWLIRFAPHSELYARANDPLLLFRELDELGDITVTPGLWRHSPAQRFRALRGLLQLGDRARLGYGHRGADSRGVRIRRGRLRRSRSTS